MESLLQGLVGFCCLFLVGLGVRTMFAPDSMIDTLVIRPEGPAGLNTVRGFLGGLFLGSSIVLAAGLATGDTTFFLAVATVMGTVVLGRLAGVALDGYDKRVAFPLIAEMAMVAIFVMAHIQLRTA